MQRSTYDDLVELARICLMQARRPENKPVAAELRLMAGQYQQRAARLDGGTPPDIETGSTGTKHRDNTTCSKPRELAGIDRNYLYRMMKKPGIARKE